MVKTTTVSACAPGAFPRRTGYILNRGPRGPGPPSDSLWTASAVEALDVGLGCGLPEMGTPQLDSVAP
jgi:hypothetical protein